MGSVDGADVYRARARHMADALDDAAGRAETLAQAWEREAAERSDDRSREAASRAELCRRKARLWRLAAAFLDDAASGAAKEERS